jgi:hypothetical protein
MTFKTRRAGRHVDAHNNHNIRTVRNRTTNTKSQISIMMSTEAPRTTNSLFPGGDTRTHTLPTQAFFLARGVKRRVPGWCACGQIHTTAITTAATTTTTRVGTPDRIGSDRIGRTTNPPRTMVGANPRSSVRPMQHGSYGALLYDPRASPLHGYTSRQEAKQDYIEKWIFLLWMPRD